jgi:lipocalin-like protein
MKRLLCFCLISVLFAMNPTPGSALPGSEDRDGNQSVKNRFVGAWRLVSLQTSGPDGQIQKTDSTGMFVFTRDGHASVQVMDRNPQPQAAAGPEQYSHGGYEATFGTYEVDETARTLTFHVEGALVRGLIGKDLPRYFEFSGNQLIVKSTRPEERWRVTWERY